MSKQINYNDIYEQCKDHMHAYVLAETVDGTKMDGIITGLDEENVYLAIPTGGGEETYQGEGMSRQYGQHGFGSSYGSGPGYGHGLGYGSGYGGYPSYGYGQQGYFNPPQRFRRLVLPLAALAALSILPWY